MRSNKVIRNIIEFFQSPIIQVALVSGFWLVAMSYVSKRVLPEPMRKLWLSLPPLMLCFYQYARVTKRFARFSSVGYWLVAFSVVNLSIVLFHLYRAGLI